MDKKTRLSLSTAGSRGPLPGAGNFVCFPAPVLSQNENLAQGAPSFQQHSQAMEGP